MWQSKWTHVYDKPSFRACRAITQLLAMSYKYFFSLDCPDQRRFIEKLKINGENSFWSLRSSQRLVDKQRELLAKIGVWLGVWEPLYLYLIDSTGQFTEEKLKEFKSFKAYNYFSMVTCRRYSTTRVNTILLCWWRLNDRRTKQSGPYLIGINTESLHWTYDTQYSRTIFWWSN